ncbi:hemolysin III family protein [Thermoactinomyces sp. DSM 45892]|uniref:PAQR family membrane homeostasis protein TrhA n=1 Tax=Thermoactinomyces sp. DSM 45892 TaxID=1882753 RepID=UPI000896D551|nr:hemolysin III family protein [Thermoactinomyces sp. DSM 45892]SDY14818.1 hemolysin III [Thermoactinomyces sp. DSM 45892]
MKFLRMREPVNTWTHFASFLAGIVGLVFLIVLTYQNPTKLLTMIIYGVSLIVLFGASSLYHWVHVKPKTKLALRKFDHIAIYFFIAGTYTPVVYVGLEGAWRITMLICVWSLAIVGMVMKLWFMNVPRIVSTIFYVTLGWLAIVPFGQFIEHLPIKAIILLIAGGVAYTVGAVIYATKIFDFIPNKFGFHEIFHIFIMLGSLAHFLMISMYIVPL